MVRKFTTNKAFTVKDKISDIVHLGFKFIASLKMCRGYQSTERLVTEEMQLDQNKTKITKG
jgi:hypothetical protein